LTSDRHRSLASHWRTDYRHLPCYGSGRETLHEVQSCRHSETVFAADGLPTHHHALDHRRDVVPDLGPCVARRRSERLRVLNHAEELTPGIVVDLDELRAAAERGPAEPAGRGEMSVPKGRGEG
jgi:hypothetical protein